MNSSFNLDLTFGSLGWSDMFSLSNLRISLKTYLEFFSIKLFRVGSRLRTFWPNSCRLHTNCLVLSLSLPVSYPCSESSWHPRPILNLPYDPTESTTSRMEYQVKGSRASSSFFLFSKDQKHIEMCVFESHSLSLPPVSPSGLIDEAATAPAEKFAVLPPLLAFFTSSFSSISTHKCTH